MIAFDIDDFELAPMAPGLRVSFPLHSATGTASTATVLFELDPGAELRVLGTFSASTVVSTFERPFEENGPQIVVIGSPVALSGRLEEPVPA